MAVIASGWRSKTLVGNTQSFCSDTFPKVQMLVLECAHHKNEIDQNRRTLYHLKCFKEDVKKTTIKKHVFKNATLNKVSQFLGKSGHRFQSVSPRNDCPKPASVWPAKHWNTFIDQIQSNSTSDPFRQVRQRQARPSEIQLGSTRFSEWCSPIATWSINRVRSTEYHAYTWSCSWGTDIPPRPWLCCRANAHCYTPVPCLSIKSLVHISTDKTYPEGQRSQQDNPWGTYTT